MLKRTHGTSFDWLFWSGGGLTRLGLANRSDIIKMNAHLIRKFAIGYTEGEDVICRPKKNERAVMFLKDEEFFWTHLTKEEFEFLFEGSITHPER